MHPTDLELLDMQADALYVHDTHNRLLRNNVSDSDQPTPRFFMSCSLSGNIWRTRCDLSDELAAELDGLAAAEPILTDLSQPPDLTKYTQLLERYAPVTNTHAGPAYYLPELDSPTDAVTITPENMTLLQANFPYTYGNLEERAPVVVIVEDGVAVSACFSARITPHVAEAGVHTLDAYQKRGYAAETVRGWAAAVRRMGRLPLYSTWWANTASQNVARKLGAVQYAAQFNLA